MTLYTGILFHHDAQDHEVNTLPRAIKIIDENLRKTNEVVEFWQARDPDLFSFLSRSK